MAGGWYHLTSRGNERGRIFRWDSLVGGLLLGSEEWVEQIRSGLVGNEKEQREIRALKKLPTWKSVVGAVEAVKGERWEESSGTVTETRGEMYTEIEAVVKRGNTACRSEGKTTLLILPPR